MKTLAVRGEWVSVSLLLLDEAGVCYVSFGLIHDFSVLGLSLTFHITSAQILPAAEEAAPEEDENEENPFSTEFHEDQEAAYLKDPKKALQGFYDREGEKKYCRALKD